MSNQLEKLRVLLRFHEHITFATPDSVNFVTLREAYILDYPAVPLAIVRPQTVTDIALLVSHAVAEGIPICVRGGGHDLFGRCFASGAIVIDMRDMASVSVATDRCSANIGGGVLASSLATELSRHKLATAVGSAPTVGWVGWATHGGYGPFVANYGLGVDQILGATIINCKGDIVEADELMLEAIRGGGGCIGVIAELTIKVYPLNQVLGGVLLFRTEHFGATFSKFTAGYKALEAQGLPDALGIQQSYVNTTFGKVFSAIFVWSSDNHDLGHRYLQQIKQLGDVFHDSVVPRRIEDWLDDSGSFVPKSAHGGNCTISVHNFTDEVIATMGNHLADMPPDPATLFSVHELRGKSASLRPDSVFGARIPHYVMEFIATSSSPQQARDSWKWATGFRDAVKNTETSNISRFTYISLTPPSDADYAAIYGPCWGRLLKIKKKYDPDNVFKHAMPQFELATK